MRDKQEELRQFVGREVIYCLSNLVYELCDRGLRDEFINVLAQPDYDTALSDCGIEILQDPDTGEWFWRRVERSSPFKFPTRRAALIDAGVTEFSEPETPDLSESGLMNQALENGYTAQKQKKGSRWRWVLYTEQRDDTKSLKRDDAVWDACAAFAIDPEYIEAYEHWLVSGWLGEKLQARGEMVDDVFGLTIWGRTCTGQAIYMDSVIEEIYDEVFPERAGR